MPAPPGDPPVSVVIPVFNGERFLAQALASVAGQSVAAAEVFVVDDGSTDDSRQIVESSGVECHYVYQRNLGPAGARNAGLSRVGGEVVAFLDADDVWPPDKLETQLACLRESPPIDVVMGHVQRFKTEASGDTPFGIPVVTYCVGAALFRRHVFDSVGVFDASLRYSEDVDWFNRAREQSVGMMIDPRVGLLYRRHPDSMTQGKDVRSLNVLKVLKQSLDRRRSADDALPSDLPKVKRRG